MMMAAAKALASISPTRKEAEGALLPPLETLRRNVWEPVYLLYKLRRR
jgi:malic enzyme